MNEPQQPEDLPQHLMALAASVIYGVMVCVAVLWLWLRDRQHVLPELALGHDALTSLGVGAGVGLGFSGVFWLLARYWRSFATLEDRLEELVGDLTDSEIVAIAMASAIGEEMFFRAALQDQCGEYWYLSAVVFGLLHTRPGLLLWGFTATALGLVFSVMVYFGFGLLSVTVAHALINFISLRRMVLK